MIADQTRTTKPALGAAAFRTIAMVGTCFWYLLRLHMAETHGLPRSSAGEAPVDWLKPQERKGARVRIVPDAYGRWSLRPAQGRS